MTHVNCSMKRESATVLSDTALFDFDGVYQGEGRKIYEAGNAVLFGRGNHGMLADIAARADAENIDGYDALTRYLPDLILDSQTAKMYEVGGDYCANMSRDELERHYERAYEYNPSIVHALIGEVFCVGYSATLQHMQACHSTIAIRVWPSLQFLDPPYLFGSNGTLIKQVVEQYGFPSTLDDQVNLLRAQYQDELAAAARGEVGGIVNKSGDGHIEATNVSADGITTQTVATLTEPPRRVGKKTGRNEPCPCGSGRKFKKCCAAAQAR